MKIVVASLFAFLVSITSATAAENTIEANTALIKAGAEPIVEKVISASAPKKVYPALFTQLLDENGYSLELMTLGERVLFKTRDVSTDGGVRVTDILNCLMKIGTFVNGQNYVIYLKGPGGKWNLIEYETAKGAGEKNFSQYRCD